MDITELELDTEYEVYVVALDDKGTIRKSAVIKQKTLNKQYLIKDGKVLVDMAKENISSATENNGFITVVTSNINYRAAYCTNETINFSNYSKLSVDMELISKTSSDNGTLLYLGVFINNTGEDFDNSLLIANNEISSADRKTYSKNIDNMNNFYKIAIIKNATYSNTQVKCNIYNLWLEK